MAPSLMWWWEKQCQWLWVLLMDVYTCSCIALQSGRTEGEYFDKINRPNTPIGQKWLNWPTVQCSSVSVQRVNVHIVDAVNSIVWQKLLRVLNLRKTSIIYTVSSLDKTLDISKLEQFHISDIYLDCKGAKVLHITAWMQIRCAQSQSCICSISLSYTLKWIWKPCLCHGLI